MQLFCLESTLCNMMINQNICIESVEVSEILSSRADQSNHNVPNVAISLLPKSEDCIKSLHFHTMASYNDSNRVPDHATRWNSR
jgi:hypothetical protein